MPAEVSEEDPLVRPVPLSSVHPLPAVKVIPVAGMKENPKATSCAFVVVMLLEFQLVTPDCRFAVEQRSKIELVAMPDSSCTIPARNADADMVTVTLVKPPAMFGML